jgi:hypothetical protein
MTVKELINCLQIMDQNLPVIVRDNGGDQGYIEFVDVDIIDTVKVIQTDNDEQGYDEFYESAKNVNQEFMAVKISGSKISFGEN